VAIKCPKCHSENPETKQFCADCGTQLTPFKGIHPEVTETIHTPVKELTRGSTFARRYDIIEELGKGGMGKVYRVFDKKIDEEVALKLIKPEIAADEETIKRFSSELKLARKIAHRNVCKMYDLMEDEGAHFITMEYVTGEDLKSFIRRSRQLTVGTAIAIAKQVCEGLAEAHRLGVVHRDLKPSNIMIDKEGNARIMDFGIARSLKGKGITGAGLMIGTPEYMSPEQVDGKDVDERSDIYSLGIILYEMLTGKRPFEGDTTLSVAVKQKSEMPPNPKLFNLQISDDLSRVILKCLEKKKESRYQSSRELLSDLEAVEKGLPTTEKAVEKKPEIVPGDKKKWQGSIAVLPFANMSVDPEQEYFCDGMAEEIINALTQVEGMRVVARTSAFSFKGKNINVREIGRELDVESVLEGSVRKAGNRLRITVQLINVADGFHLWSERYDRDMADVFAIQDEIALAIVDKLKVKLLGKEKAALVKRHTGDPEAYTLYLKGRSSLQTMTEEGFRRGIDIFERAAAKDPDFALPLAGLSYLYITRSYWGRMRPHDALPKARAYARQALEKDRSLGLAYAASGYVKAFYDWDWPGGEWEFKRALELNPNSPDIHLYYSFFLTCTGRHDEAVIEAKKAQELDPLSSNINSHTAEVLYWAGRTDSEVIEILKETISLDPYYYFAHWVLYMIYTHKSMIPEATEECEKAAELSGRHPLPVIGLIALYNQLGRAVEADKLEKSLKDRSQGEYIPSMCCFLLHLWRKELEQAAEWLEKACAERDSYLPWILVHPNPKRRVPDLPIFNAILKKYGLKS
jgi:serine/threonine protein kinase